MTRDESIDLVRELEEELDVDGVLPLYQFTWYQDIGSRPDERDAILRLAQDAYDEMCRRRPDARLGWVTWPHLSPDAVETSEAGTRPDFLLDPDGAEPRTRIQVLVVDQLDP